MGQSQASENHDTCMEDMLEGVPKEAQYASKTDEELKDLVRLRGISLPDLPGCQEVLQRSVVTTLLQAYDAGLGAASAAESTTAASSVSNPGQSSEVPLCASVVSVLQKIRDAPGHMGCDIGGTLVKMVLALPTDVAADSYHFPEHFGKSGRAHNNLEISMRSARGERFVLRFLSGSTNQLEAAVLQLGIRRQMSRRRPVEGGQDDLSPSASEGADMSPAFARCYSDWSDEVFSSSRRCTRRMATAGGGACKLAPLFRDALLVDIEPVKELSAVVDGLLMLAPQGREAEVKGSGCCAQDLFSVGADGSQTSMPWPSQLFPLIVVNMGSGVSILRVDSAAPGDFTRVGGTACGGGTFLGLARALTSATTFDEALDLAAKGDAKRADKLVSDIYGEDGCTNLGLPAHLTASNFGKLGDHPRDQFMDVDIARSILQMVTQQSVLLSSAYAKSAGCLDRVFFVGGFVDSPNWMARQSIANNFRNLGGCAYFLKHSDFLGALGSLKCALRVGEVQISAKG